MRFEFEAVERPMTFDIGMEVTHSDVRLLNNASTMTLDLVPGSVDLDFRIAHRDGLRTMSFEMGFCPAISHVLNDDGTVDIIIEGLDGTQTIENLVTAELLNALLAESLDDMLTSGGGIYLPKSAGPGHPLTGDLYKMISGTRRNILSDIDGFLGISESEQQVLMRGDMFIEQVDQDVVSVVESEEEEEEEEEEEQAAEPQVVHRKNVSNILRNLYIVNAGTEQYPINLMRSELPYVTCVGGYSDIAVARDELDTTLFYRLDEWEEDMDDDGGWVLSAKLGWDLKNTIDRLVAMGGVGGGSNVKFEPHAGGIYGDLTAGNNIYHILLYDHITNYLLAKRVFDDIFLVTDALITVKNVGNTLRGLAVPGNLTLGTAQSPASAMVYGNIKANGWITAGDINPDSVEPSPDVLYIFDTWDLTAEDDWEEMAFSAGLAYQLKQQVTTLAASIANGGGGGGSGSGSGGGGGSTVTFTVASGSPYGVLTVDGTANNILLYSTFNNLFTVTDSLLTIKNVGNDLRGLTVPGALTANSASIATTLAVTGNVTIGDSQNASSILAYGNIKANGWITAGDINPSSVNPSPDVLYIFDDWELDVLNTGWQEWALSAGLAYQMKQQIAALGNNITAVGASVSFAQAQNSDYYGILTVSSQNYNIVLYDHITDYLLAKSIFTDLFTVTDALLTIRNVGNTLRGLTVPGALTANTGSITGALSVGGNASVVGSFTVGDAQHASSILAYGNIKANGWITAGDINPESVSASGDVLYIFDDWENDVLNTGWQEWALSAGLAVGLKNRIAALELLSVGSGYVRTTMSGGLNIEVVNNGQVPQPGDSGYDAHTLYFERLASNGS